MRILVTGGAGFLGNILIPKLAKDKKNQILVFDNFSHGFPKKQPRRKNILPAVSGNIRNYYDISRVMERFKPEVIIHLACHATRPESIGDLKLCAEVNYLGTANIISACLVAKETPKKLIFSSCEASRFPTSHYGVSKLASERLIESLSSTFDYLDLSTTILRFSEIYGHSQSYTSRSLVNFLVDNMVLDNNIIVFGANKKKDFVNVEDASRACEAALYLEGHHTFDIGPGKGIVIKDLVSKIKKLTSYKGQLRFEDSPIINVVDSVAEPKEANKILGFKCQADFEKEIKALVAKRRKDLK